MLVESPRSQGVNGGAVDAYRPPARTTSAPEVVASALMRTDNSPIHPRSALVGTGASAYEQRYGRGHRNGADRRIGSSARRSGLAEVAHTPHTPIIDMTSPNSEFGPGGFAHPPHADNMMAAAHGTAIRRPLPDYGPPISAEPVRTRRSEDPVAGELTSILSRVKKPELPDLATAQKRMDESQLAWAAQLVETGVMDEVKAAAHTGRRVADVKARIAANSFNRAAEAADKGDVTFKDAAANAGRDVADVVVASLMRRGARAHHGTATIAGDVIPDGLIGAEVVPDTGSHPDVFSTAWQPDPPKDEKDGVTEAWAQRVRQMATDAQIGVVVRDLPPDEPIGADLSGFEVNIYEAFNGRRVAKIEPRRQESTTDQKELVPTG